MGLLCHSIPAQVKFFFLCAIFVNECSVSVMVAVKDSVGHLDDLHRLDHNLNDIKSVDNPPVDADQELDQDVDSEVENIRRAMLQGLGFKKTPDVTKMNVSQDEYSRMYDVYLNRLEQRVLESEEEEENVPKFYTYYQKDRHFRRRRRRGVTHLVFNVTASSDGASIEHSTLRLLAAGSDRTGPVKVLVYQVLENQRTRLIEEKEIFLAEGAPKWAEFDVTQAVRSWKEESQSNLGLELRCEECRLRRHGLVSTSGEAVINALIIEDSNRRRKRSDDQALYYQKDRRTDCHIKHGKKCCRHKMDFDLMQLGMDFIIQPKKFDGGICKGRCPPHYNAAHNHAVLQSLMWRQNKNLTPRVCCAPSKLHHLEILTVDEDNPAKLSVKQWENMVVLECACS